MPPTQSSVIRLADAGHVEGVPDDARLVSINLGVDGALTCAWASPSEQTLLTAYTEVPNWARFPAARTAEPVTLLVTITANGQTTAVHTTPLSIALPKVVRLPASGDLVVVGTRCYLVDGEPERNAMRLSADGALLHEGTLGDGIEHIVATTEDDLWVGYFDEGVFGNYGWGEGTAPIGAPGLVRFDRDFAVRWRYPAGASHHIEDLYTMTLSGNDLFACPYSDFPILRIQDDVVESWAGLGTGARLTMVSANRVALLGDYKTHWSEGVIVDLATRDTVPVRVEAPRGVNLDSMQDVATMGDTIVVLQGTRILKGTLEAE